MILNIHDQLKYIQNKYIKSGVIMLSTQYRLKLEGICQKIISRETVELEEMIWAEKLAKANRSAATMLRQARRKAENPDMTEDSLDGFLNALDIGGVGHEGKGIRRFESVDDIVDFFSSDKPEDWRQRD
jgi:hypothetical protein